jgi:hypothetical protein
LETDAQSRASASPLNGALGLAEALDAHASENSQMQGGRALQIRFDSRWHSTSKTLGIAG